MPVVPKLGELGHDPTVDLGRKDAFHVPAVLVQSVCGLQPGTPVWLVGRGCKLAEPCSILDRHGIVDPFLRVPVEPGESFWMLCEPGLVKNLTHTFEIPESEMSRYQENRSIDDFDDDDYCNWCDH